MLYQGTFILKICGILWTLSRPKIHKAFFFIPGFLQKVLGLPETVLTFCTSACVVEYNVSFFLFIAISGSSFCNNTVQVLVWDQLK